MKFLVVDDDAIIRDLLSEIITSKGYEVEVAVDGVDALEKMSRQSFDVALTDLSMPRMGGIEFIKSVKAANPDIPMLAVTAFPSLENGIQAIKEGASDFIPKPFDVYKLAIFVDRLVNERKLLLERKQLAKDEEARRQLLRMNEALFKKKMDSSMLVAISERINVISDNIDLMARIVETALEIVKTEIVAVGIRVVP
jgi:DNA-binding NtrC family response regulator